MAQEPHDPEGTVIHYGQSEYQFASGFVVAQPQRMVYLDFFQVSPHDNSERQGIARIVVVPEIAAALAKQLSGLELSER